MLLLFFFLDVSQLPLCHVYIMSCVYAFRTSSTHYNDPAVSVRKSVKIKYCKHIQKSACTVYPVWSLPVIIRIGRVKGKKEEEEYQLNLFLLAPFFNGSFNCLTRSLYCLTQQYIYYNNQSLIPSPSSLYRRQFLFY
jgi:hypothetical protein